MGSLGSLGSSGSSGSRGSRSNEPPGPEPHEPYAPNEPHEPNESIEPKLISNILLFGRVLRAAGVHVHRERMVDAIQATEWIGLRSRADLRATLSALLVHRHEDLPLFNEAFDLF